MADSDIRFESSGPETRSRGVVDDVVVVLVVAPGDACSQLCFGFEVLVEGIKGEGEPGGAAKTCIRPEQTFERRGPWGPGTHRLTLPVRTPRYPLTFRGDAVKVGWTMTVAASLGNREVRASTPIQVAAASEEPRAVLPTANGDRDAVEQQPEAEPDPEGFGFPIFLASIASILMTIGGVALVREATAWGWLVGAVVAGLMAYGAFAAARDRRGARTEKHSLALRAFEAYGNPQRELTFDPAGPMIDCRLFVRPGCPELSPVAVLTIDEITWIYINRDHGNGVRKPRQRTLKRVEVALHLEEPGCYCARLPVPGPEEVPETLDAPWCKLRWRVAIQSGIEGSLDDAYPLKVRPAELLHELGDAIV